MLNFTINKNRFIIAIRWFLWDFSGLRFIYEKLIPPKDQTSNTRKPSTVLLWSFGVYVAFFGVSSQRYENRIDIIENRANALFNQLSSIEVRKNALGKISRIQNMTCPSKPNILNPPSVFKSLFYESTYTDMVVLLKETMENWKDSLDNIYLGEADMTGIILNEANLSKSNMSKANLSKAKIWESKLSGSSLADAILVDAEIFKSDLTGASLFGANLTKTKFHGSNLNNADLMKSNVRGAVFNDADLSYTNFYKAKGLIVDQLCDAETLRGIKIETEINDELVRKCPNKLNK